jgi:hypothetical protein
MPAMPGIECRMFNAQCIMAGLSSAFAIFEQVVPPTAAANIGAKK